MSATSCRGDKYKSFIRKSNKKDVVTVMMSILKRAVTKVHEDDKQLMKMILFL